MTADDGLDLDPETVTAVGEAIGLSLGDCSIMIGQGQLSSAWSTYRLWSIRVLRQLGEAGFEVRLREQEGQ